MSKPKIRFKGFIEDWEQRKLDDVAKFTKGTGYSKGDLVDSGTPIILYGRLYTNYETTIRDVDTFVVEKENSVFSRGGEVIVPASGETAEDIARASAVENAGVLLGGDLNIIETGENINSSFLALTISNGNSQKELAKKAQGKSVVHIRNDEIKRVLISLPTKVEQDKIAIYFDKLDTLITLHQRKCDETKKLKKYMLQKMFPQNGKNIPEIRFDGFTEDWEQCKFKNIFDYLQNNTLSRAGLSEEGSVFNVHYGDVLIKFGEVIDIQRDRLPSIFDESVLGKYQSSVLQNGDIIIADAAEDETVGKCSEIKGITNEKVLAGLHTIPVRPKKKYAMGFMGYYMNSNAYHNQLLPLMQGTKVSSISKSAIQETDVLFPKNEGEQQKIGAYFQSLDHFITLHQQKYEELQKIKKFMLQNMFI